MKRAWFLLLLLLFLSGCSTGGVIKESPRLEDQGNIELYFCPQEQCEEELVSFLDSAEQSIHCAFFDIGLETVKEVLVKKEKIIEVKIVTDNDYLKKFNHSFVKADKYGLMHNKFCIVDGKKVSSGSMNPTDNDAHKNNNNLLLIDSGLIAQNYEDEFKELWNGTFKKGSRVKNPEIVLSDVPVQTYFCPEDDCAEQTRIQLQKANLSIYFMTFSFTHEGIANIILLKNLGGVEVKGVMEVRQISKYSQFNRLLQNGIEVRKDGNKNNLHHKVFIIDEKVVVTGSFNPTGGGDERNDENLMIIENEEIAKQFVEEFWKVYGEGSVSS